MSTFFTLPQSLNENLYQMGKLEEAKISDLCARDRLVLADSQEWSSLLIRR